MPSPFFLPVSRLVQRTYQDDVPDTFRKDLLYLFATYCKEASRELSTTAFMTDVAELMDVALVRGLALQVIPPIVGYMARLRLNLTKERKRSDMHTGAWYDYFQNAYLSWFLGDPAGDIPSYESTDRIISVFMSIPFYPKSLAKSFDLLVKVGKAFNITSWNVQLISKVLPNTYGSQLVCGQRDVFALMKGYRQMVLEWLLAGRWKDTLSIWVLSLIACYNHNRPAIMDDLVALGRSAEILPILWNGEAPEEWGSYNNVYFSDRIAAILAIVKRLPPDVKIPFIPPDAIANYMVSDAVDQIDQPDYETLVWVPYIRQVLFSDRFYTQPINWSSLAAIASPNYRYANKRRMLWQMLQSKISVERGGLVPSLNAVHRVVVNNTRLPVDIQQNILGFLVPEPDQAPRDPTHKQTAIRRLLGQKKDRQPESKEDDE
jgi:hypothetical protein